MEMFIQMIVSGLATGSLYALAALGIVLLFNTSGIMNFAQGEIGMFSTFVALFFMTTMGFNYWIALLMAIIFAAILGIVIERVLIRPVQDASHLTIINMTFGLFMVLNGTAGIIWGYTPQSFPQAVEGTPFQIFGIVLERQSVLILAVTAVISLGMFLLFKFSMLGISMRAASQDKIATKIMGVKINRVFSAGWAISAFLAAIAGVFIAPTTFLDPNMMSEVLLKAFAASVLGGITKMHGAIIGGLLIGTSENLIAAYISTDLKSTFSFALIILVLLVKPYGILGRAEGKRV